MKDVPLSEVTHRIDQIIKRNNMIIKQLKLVIPKLQKASYYSIEHSVKIIKEK